MKLSTLHSIDHLGVVVPFKSPSGGGGMAPMSLIVAKMELAGSYHGAFELLVDYGAGHMAGIIPPFSFFDPLLLSNRLVAWRASFDTISPSRFKIP